MEASDDSDYDRVVRRKGVVDEAKKGVVIRRCRKGKRRLGPKCTGGKGRGKEVVVDGRLA